MADDLYLQFETNEKIMYIYYHNHFERIGQAENI